MDADVGIEGCQHQCREKQGVKTGKDDNRCQRQIGRTEDRRRGDAGSHRFRLSRPGRRRLLARTAGGPFRQDVEDLAVRIQRSAQNPVQIPQFSRIAPHPAATGTQIQRVALLDERSVLHEDVHALETVDLRCPFLRILPRQHFADLPGMLDKMVDLPAIQPHPVPLGTGIDHDAAAGHHLRQLFPASRTLHDFPPYIRRVPETPAGRRMKTNGTQVKRNERFFFYRFV